MVPAPPTGLMEMPMARERITEAAPAHRQYRPLVAELSTGHAAPPPTRARREGNIGRCSCRSLSRCA